MANCPNCNTRLDKEDRFCSFCGSFNSECRSTAEDRLRIWQAAQKAYQRGDHANGVTVFKQVISFSPATLEAYYYLADCYTSLGQIDQAIETLRAAQTRQPGSSTICFNLGVLEQRRGRKFEARQYIQEALRLLDIDAMVNNRDELRAQMQRTLTEL